MADKLIEAAQNGDIKRVKRLLKGRCHVNAANDLGETALYHAVER